MYRIPIASALALALFAAPAFSQARPLYATNGNGAINTIQNGAFTGQFLGEIAAFGIAVGSDIRTVGSSHGLFGRAYTLGGTPSGPAYVNTSGASCCFYDGTTDGTYNYATDYAGGRVWRAALDWSSMTPLFSTAAQSRYTLGITYDSGNNSLWVGQYANGGSNAIFQYALNGTLLSSFNPNLGGNGITALAYDAADQTLWFSDYTQSPTLYQYTRTGTQLSSVSVAGFNGGMLSGAEFQMTTTATPEPASLVLLGTGLIGVAGFAARRRPA